jgi:hypothetical protein
MGMLSFLCEEIGNFEEAIEYCENALKINQSDIWAIHSKAHIFYMKGN